MVFRRVCLAYLEASNSILVKKHYPSVTLTRISWDLWLEIFGLRSLAWDLWLGILGLGSLAWDLWLGTFGLGSLAWQLWLRIFCLGSQLGGVRLGGLGSCIEESKQA